jgi:hypothetical protein
LTIYQDLGLADGTNYRECFVLAIATLFRLSYSGVPLDATGIWLIQAVEASVGMLLGILGLRVIYATASRAADRVSGDMSTRN